MDLAVRASLAVFVAGRTIDVPSLRAGSIQDIR